MKEGRKKGTDGNQTNRTWEEKRERKKKKDPWNNFLFFILFLRK